MGTDWMRPYLKYDSLDWEDIEEGETLPPVTRDVDATLVVVGALATRDMYPVHHDRAAAEQAGTPDVFMNILTTNGLMATYVTNWCGHAWDLRSIGIRLMMPNFPGDKMTTTGTVSRKWVEGGQHLVEVEFRAENGIGVHCQGSAVIAYAGKEGRA